MIIKVNDITAISFMAMFEEARSEEFWDQLVDWIGKGKPTPMLNLAKLYDGKIVGLFPCEAYKDRLMIHAFFHPEFRGDFAVKSAKEAFEWIWNNTDYDKIQAYIEPAHVKRYAVCCGMEEHNGLYEVSKCQRL